MSHRLQMCLPQSRPLPASLAPTQLWLAVSSLRQSPCQCSSPPLVRGHCLPGHHICQPLAAVDGGRAESQRARTLSGNTSTHPPLSPLDPALHPPAGGDVTAWAYSLANTAKTTTFIANQPFTPTDGAGTTTDPYTVDLTIPGLPDGVYLVSVTATTATGSANSNWSPPVVLGTPPAPTIAAVSSTPQNVTIKVTTLQTVTVSARRARAAKSITIRGGSTAASQPKLFTVTLK